MRTLILLLLLNFSAGTAEAYAGIRWQPWSPQAFQQAKAQHKLVFLYLEATWCHWCHVMQDSTFKDAEVQRALGHDYIVLRVDHDANPLLANRYRDYGWPALIFFSADGTEIVKRAGYIEPEAFRRLLAAIVKDPSPETADARVQAASSPALSAAQRQNLLKRHHDSYDEALGGLQTTQKYLERDSVEYTLEHARDAKEAKRAMQTLTAANALIDPVWGGMYQYSTHEDWAHPHYEKIMRTQAGGLRLYSLAYASLHRDEDLRAADRIQDYLFKFLRSKNGTFFVSQDADLKPGQKADEYFALNNAERRKLGVPRIDRSVYSDSNGLAAEALAFHALYGGRPDSLAAAIKAMDWIMSHRRGALGGLRHGEKQEPIEYLSDNLAVGRASLALYRVTADRRWLANAIKLGDHISATFTLPSGGLASASLNVRALPPAPVMEENLSAARFLGLLHAYSGKLQHHQAAESALRWSIGSDTANPAFEEAGLLLADDVLSRPPLHLTVVGARKDPQAQALFKVASQFPSSDIRVEWLDRSEGPLPNQDVVYPNFPRAAGYSCEAQRCSAPRFTPSEYAAAIASLGSSR